MGDRFRSASIKELPSHLILEILTSGRLSAVDLVSLELTSSIFGGNHGLYPHKFRSLVDFVAFQLCDSNTIYARMAGNAQRELFDRCNGNWKRVLRFLQSVEQSSGMVETSAGKMQITTGRYHTLLIKNSTVYSCGTSVCGVLGQGPEATQCVAFTRIDFPSLAQVMHVSATQYHAAFVMQSGQVFTCGDNSSFCCGHSTARPIFRPRLVEALEGVPCMQVIPPRHISWLGGENIRMNSKPELSVKYYNFEKHTADLMHSGFSILRPLNITFLPMVHSSL